MLRMSRYITLLALLPCMGRYGETSVFTLASLNCTWNLCSPFGPIFCIKEERGGGIHEVNNLEVDMKFYISAFEFIPFIRRVIQFIMYCIF